MDRDLKRLLLAIGAGVAMSGTIWLFVGAGSPARESLQDHGAAYAVMVLNLPALFVSRVISGTPPTDAWVYGASFVQWFAIALAVSSWIWPLPKADAASGVGG